MRQLIKEQAINCKQSPLEKGFRTTENFLKFAGMARGLWDTGKAVVGGIQAAAPYVRGAATAISML